MDYTNDTNETIKRLSEEVDSLKREIDRLKILSSGIDADIPVNCRRCSNHPSNGGSGICYCTLGGAEVTC